MSDQAERCVMCGQPWPGQGKPIRSCWQCKRQIKRGHKWHIVDSRIQHRNCLDPESYSVVVDNNAGRT